MSAIASPATASTSGTSSAPAIRVEGVSVAFGEVRALREVSLTLDPGLVHVLVGQNGAGKTTLARVISGLIRPDAGHVEIGGRAMPAGDVAAARAAGVEMVHQSFTLPPSFTVAEALEFATARRAGGPVYRRKDLDARWRAELEQAGIDVPIRARIRELPIEALQSLEITRALVSQARILILDEPTALLAPAGITRLFERLRRLRDEGITVVVVLHKLAEVAAIAERISVLRDGQLVVPPTDAATIDQGRVADEIVGAHIATDLPTRDFQADDRQVPHLRLTGVTTRGSAAEPALASLDLVVHSHEIVGIAGVEGNGQKSLVGVVTGLDPVESGRIELADADVTGTSLAQRRAQGLRIVPFDRNTEGVSQSSSLWENVAVLGVLTRRKGRSPFLSLRAIKRDAKAAMDRWNVKYGDIGQPAGSLSGGNVQRLILSRELAPGVSLLVAAQPTRGLDIAATALVRDALRELRDEGGSVLLVSSDLDELFELSDRLLVMRGGAVVAEFRPPFELRRIGDAMVGAAR
jgi:simple sugar transport system ATP-binding protein